MSAILVKILATALTMAQVTTRPDAIETSFDPTRDRGKVVQLLRDGCAHMRRAFDIEDIKLDDLIATALEDPDAVTGGIEVLHGLDFRELQTAYRQICTSDSAAGEPAQISEIITFFNEAVADLPDPANLASATLPQMSVLLDARGQRFAEIFEPDQRRVSVPLDQIPPHVRQAFVSAEDKRFFEHRGIDERGVIRAFMGNFASPGRPQGGSTITQQVVKNLLVGDDVTYERKMREMIVASRLERAIGKERILELYLNAIYFGRSAWGIEAAAQAWFGKPASALDVAEGAFLASLVKGPNYYNPDRNAERSHERYAYVLSRMQEDGALTQERLQALAPAFPKRVAPAVLARDSGFHFVDQAVREAKSASSVASLTSAALTVKTTLLPDLQRATEAALQEGLARYEQSNGRQKFTGPEANVAEAVRKLPANDQATGAPPWQQALTSVRLPLYDVHWQAVVLLEKTRSRKGGDVLRVGLADGRILPLQAPATVRKQLKLYDVVFAQVAEGTTKTPARASLRTRPQVQGAALVLENRTGRILALSGGFSYPLSQLNRATQAHRQPGSTLKPLTYLAALQAGLQPNTLIADVPITLPPPGWRSGGGGGRSWTPRNYDGRSAGILTLRRGLELSRNVITARLLDGPVAEAPEQSLARICELAQEAHLYLDCEPYYPFVLGAQPLKMVDLAAFYAAIANEGARPAPHLVESVTQNGRALFRHEGRPPVRIGSVDPAAAYQLKSMLQGVVERGTASGLRKLAPYVAGKTGTSDDENDAWFVGFTNDVTIAVWAGYDNATGGRRTLGRGKTGANVAAPIFAAIVEAAWRHHEPKSPLSPPSPAAQNHLVNLPIDRSSGDRITDGRPDAFQEVFRLDERGALRETQFSFVAPDEVYASRGYAPGDGFAEPGWVDESNIPWDSLPPPPPGVRGVPPWWAAPEARRPRRVDPDYFWGPERVY